MDPLGALALRPDESVADEDFDFARALANGEDGFGFIALRCDIAPLRADADIALGTGMKSIDAVGVPALGGDGDVPRKSSRIAPVPPWEPRMPEESTPIVVISAS